MTMAITMSISMTIPMTLTMINYYYDHNDNRSVTVENLKEHKN